MSREVLYVKYNSTRTPAFQTKIVIARENGNILVERYPITEMARSFVDNFITSYDCHSDLYKNVTLVRAYKNDGVVCEEYIKGRKVYDIIADNLNDAEGTIEKIKGYLDTILDYDPKYLKGTFEVTDAFIRIFGDSDAARRYSGASVTVADFDTILDNFVINEEGVICSYDYEWMMEVEVPIAFLRYRAVKMFYLSNYEHYSGDISLRDFVMKFSISSEEVALCEKMDEAFQLYVHEKNRRAMYTDRYIKKTKTISDINLMEKRLDDMKAVADERLKAIEVANDHNLNLMQVINDKQLVIDDLSETVEVLRRERRNPFYALYRLIRKICYKILPHKILRTLQILKNEGIKMCFVKVRQKIDEKSNYEEWITDLEKKQKDAEEPVVFEYKPLISVAVPVYNVEISLLKACIDSVIGQTYDNWQLCIADDCSTMPEIKELLKSYEEDPKIDIVYREENGHISRATNSAIELARGEYIALLDCDDLLTPDALYEMVRAINENPEYDLIYSDEDKIDEDGKNRNMPHFKPDWSPDTLMSNMYICHFSLYRRSILESIGGLRAGYEGSQDYDLALRFTEIIPDSHIKHVPKILYHWRTRKESTATDVNAKPYILKAAFKAKTDALRRRGLNGELELIKNIWQYRVRYIPEGYNKVSIVIPSKDNPVILERCITSIVEKTIYKNYEIIVVDNGSSEENKNIYTHLCKSNGCIYHYEKMEFNFSKMCNLGASISCGEFLLFLNDDIEIIDGEWLDRMLGQAELSYAGAVGAKLFYPQSENIQHCGVINIANGPSHAFEKFNDEDIYYFGRNKLEYNYIAVTAACLLVDRKKFDQIGGFDEQLTVSYNDVDLCFKLVEAGYYNVVRNDVILYHYESYSRGNDAIDDKKMRRLTMERNRLYEKHPAFAPGRNMDPFYSMYLSQTSADFSYNFQNMYLI